jgi:hypothetical protein
MSRRRIPVIDEARIVSELEAILTGAREAGAWAPALRAVELLGRHIGLWRNDAKPEASLAELINDAVERAKGGEGDRD